jgi:hypothetical protein
MLPKELFVPQLSGDGLVLVLTPLGGSTFVARMLTVVTSLKSQRRNILELITQAVFAARDGQPTPSLLPDVAKECS